MNPGFWKGKRVFVTGHSGFKGTWLCSALLRFGAEVTGYSLAPPSDPCLSQLIDLRKQMECIEGDIREYQVLHRALHHCRPEVVIHMAAQSLVLPSYQDPVATYSTNVMGTVNVLEAVRQVSGIMAVVNVTSDKCYENRETNSGHRESDPLGGYDPYSSSKACSEIITSAFRNSFFRSGTSGAGPFLASARAGNVIGGGDWGANRLVPDIMRAFSKKQTVKIRRPTALRPWQHVLEPISGYLSLAEKLCTSGAEYAEAWNFGPSDRSSRSVEWLVQQIAYRWGDDAAWEVDTSSHCHETGALKLDSSKSMSRLSWSPRMNIEAALDMTVSWHKRVESGENASAITIEQLDRFVALQPE